MSAPVPTPGHNHLVEAARRRREQVARARAERSVFRSLATIGALGWLIVTPALLALYVGRRLDQAAGGGIFWTGALLMAGIALGSALAWRRVSQQAARDRQEEDR
jgi:ATP synthase protein I